MKRHGWVQLRHLATNIGRYVDDGMSTNKIMMNSSEKDDKFRPALNLLRLESITDNLGLALLIPPVA